MTSPTTSFGSHTSKLGIVGAQKVMAHLAELGVPMFIPVDHSCPFDLLAWIGGAFKRVQIKYRRLDPKKGSIQLATRRNNHKQQNTDFDVLAVYCPEIDRCLYMNRSDYDKHATIRITKSRNGQTAGVRPADSMYYPPGL